MVGTKIDVTFVILKGRNPPSVRGSQSDFDGPVRGSLQKEIMNMMLLSHSDLYNESSLINESFGIFLFEQIFSFFVLTCFQVEELRKKEKNDKSEKMTLLNEKNSIQQIPDILELNVGGQNFTTR